MLRDKHPRERRRQELKRRKAVKRQYDRLLIVTEGSKTEPQYLEEIRMSVRASSASVRILHSATGTDPLQIVDYAEAQFLETKAFEAVYAVFDRDNHPGYHRALLKAASLNNAHKNDERKPTPFIAIPSVPNFELWVLLHYQDLWAFGNRADILPALRRHLPNYQKGASGLYERTKANLEAASSRAQQHRVRHTPQTGTDPYTDMDTLVDRLQTLRQQAIEPST